jgi:glycerate kinase
MKKILIAMDSFKGTLSSKELSELIKIHLPYKKAVFTLIPMSDGGEGFVEALTYSLDSQKRYLMVEDAFGNLKQTNYAIINNQVAIMEIALSSGLAEIEDSKLNPYLTSTYGLGETIMDALNQSVNQLIIGLGGSSTNDGGAGMLQALGVKFLNKKHQEIKRMTGLSISEIEAIDLSELDPRLFKTKIVVASDVENPLLGSQGCSKVYAGQKGASEEMIRSLEENMKHYCKIIVEKLGKDDREFPGSGAAGGLGFAFKTFLNTDLRSGFEIVSSSIQLENMIKSSDIIITGEGKFDRQSFHGKASVKIAQLGKKHHKKVIGLFGQALVDGPSKLFDEFYCIVPKFASREESLNKPKTNFIKLIESIEMN